MSENKYNIIIDNYILGKWDVNQFIDAFMRQWRDDRDNHTLNDPKFQRLIDRIFTSCDCYSDKPEGEIEINEKQLKDEVSLFRHIWFG